MDNQFVSFGCKEPPIIPKGSNSLNVSKCNAKRQPSLLSLNIDGPTLEKPPRSQPVCNDCLFEGFYCAIENKMQERAMNPNNKSSNLQLEVQVCREEQLTTGRLDNNLSSHLRDSTTSCKQVVANSKETKPKAKLMLAGIGSAILASLSFSIGYLCLKLLPNDKSVSEKAKALFIRGLIMLAISVSAVVYNRSNLKVQRREIWVISLRCMFGTMSIFGAYLALNYIPIGDTMALKFSSPVWTAILGYFILNEPLQWLLFVALPASIFGIVMIAHPALIIGEENYASITMSNVNLTKLLTNDSSGTTIEELIDSTFDLSRQVVVEMQKQEELQQRWLGIGLALFTSLCISFIYIVLKFRKTTPIITTTFWSSASMTTAGFLVMCFAGFGEIPSSSYEWILLIGNGFTSWLGQCFLQYALANADAGICSVIRTLDVALAFIWSSLFLDDDIYWTSVVGAVIIVAVVLLIMFNNWISQILCNSRESEQEDECR